MICAPAGIVTPPSSIGSRVVPERGVRNRCVVANELLDRVGQQHRIAAHERKLFRVGEQGDDSVADEARGRVVARDDELEDRRQELLFAELLVAVARVEQRAHQGIIGLASLLGDQVPEERDDRVGRDLRVGVLLVGAGRNEHLDQRSTERRASGLGDTEQLADHGEGQRECECVDQIDDGVRAACFDGIEHVVDDPLHVFMQRLYPPYRERARDESPETRVVGRIDGEHVPRERRPRETFGDDAPGSRHRRLHVLGDPRVVQRGPRLVVPDDQPGLVTVSQRHPVHRRPVANRLEQRKGIVPVERAPLGQRLLDARHT